MLKKLLACLSISLLLIPSLCFSELSAKPQTKASKVKTVITNFNKNLSSADTDVQKALETIDNFTLSVAETDPLSLHLAGDPQIVSTVHNFRNGLTAIDDTVNLTSIFLRPELGGFQIWGDYGVGFHLCNLQAGTGNVFTLGMDGYPGAGVQDYVNWDTTGLGGAEPRPILSLQRGGNQYMGLDTYFGRLAVSGELPAIRHYGFPTGLTQRYANWQWLANGNYGLTLPAGDLDLGVTNLTLSGTLEAGATTLTTAQFNHLSETKSDTYNVLLTDKGKTLVMDTVAKTFNLPSVDASNVGVWFTFVKTNAGTLIIDAADTDVINDSSAGGTLYDAQTNETYATIIVELVSATQWVAHAGLGTWTTN